MLDAQMRCLHRATGSLEATVDTLSNADVKVVDKAHKLVAQLRPLAWCEDAEALDAEMEPPLPHEAAAVGNARKALAVASSRLNGCRYCLSHHLAGLKNLLPPDRHHRRTAAVNPRMRHQP